MNSFRSLCVGFVFKANFISQRKINFCITSIPRIFGIRNYGFLFELYKKLVKNEN